MWVLLHLTVIPVDRALNGVMILRSPICTLGMANGQICRTTPHKTTSAYVWMLMTLQCALIYAAVILQDYSVVFNNLKNTAQGDILDQDKIAGPTICCAWVSKDTI